MFIHFIIIIIIIIIIIKLLKAPSVAKNKNRNRNRHSNPSYACSNRKKIVEKQIISSDFDVTISTLIISGLFDVVIFTLLLHCYLCLAPASYLTCHSHFFFRLFQPPLMGIAPLDSHRDGRTAARPISMIIHPIVSPHGVKKGSCYSIIKLLESTTARNKKPK